MIGNMQKPLKAYLCIATCLVCCSPAASEQYNNGRLSVKTVTKPDYILIEYNAPMSAHTHVNLRHPSVGQVEGPLKGQFKIKATGRISKFQMQACAKKAFLQTASVCSPWYNYRHSL